MKVEFELNPEPARVDADPCSSLPDVLGDQLGCYGSKNACTQGERGSCSRFLDDVIVCGCLVPTGQVRGRRVATVGSLGQPGVMHPMQEAFAASGGVQCGFCTPGLVIATVAPLQNRPDLSDDEIREALSGNLCRCTGYEKILDAVRMAAREAAGAGTP